MLPRDSLCLLSRETLSVYARSFTGTLCLVDVRRSHFVIYVNKS
jgi:hypothetical protein